MKSRFIENNHPKLKHCPFCGEEEDIVMRKEIYHGNCRDLEGKEFYYVECLPCDAKGIQAWEEDSKLFLFDSPQEMAAVCWNSRAPRNEWLNKLEKKIRYWKYWFTQKFIWR